MNRLSATIFRSLVRAAHPWSLLAGILIYALGGGIAIYLGDFINWPVYWIGQAAALMLLLSGYILRAYFDLAGPPFELPRQRPPRVQPPAGMQEEEEAADGNPDGKAPASEELALAVPRVIFLQVAAATLTIAAVMVVLLIALNKLNPPAFLFLVLIFLLALAYAVPPLRLVYSGYGELVIAIMVANLFPGLAFLLQAGSLHRLLAMLTFPLTLLYLAAMLALSLRGYFNDLRENHLTMLVRLGWQRAMNLHNILILMAYLVLGGAVIAGLPWRLAWPAFLSLPVGIFQIVQMNSIANGAKPHWRLLAYTALAPVGLAVYFMDLALWIG